MSKKICAVLDAKAGSYGNPIFVPSIGIAMRSFSDVVMAPQGPISDHPEDYSLWSLGTYDDNSGQFTNLDKPEFLCSAVQVKANSRLMADRELSESLSRKQAEAALADANRVVKEGA